MMVNSTFGRFVHDIATPLTMVKMNLDQLKQDELTTPVFKSSKLLQRIEAGIDELSYLVKQSSSTPERIVQRSTVIKEIHKVLRLYDLQFTQHQIQTQLDFEEDFFLVRSIDKFHRVLINLINNSVSALKNKNGEKTIYIRTYRSEVGFVISVEDNGCGISKANLQRLLTERFTTKPTGNGLGLINVKKILFESFNGIITCDSIEGKGARFEIILPDLE